MNTFLKIAAVWLALMLVASVILAYALNSLGCYKDGLRILKWLSLPLSVLLLALIIVAIFTL